MRKIKLNEETHQYFDEDTNEEIIGVSAILKDNGLSPDYSKIPQHILDFARVRGEYVQKAIDLYDEDRLDLSTLDETIKPYLDQWVKFKNEYNVRVLRNRTIIYNEELNYCGEYDKKIELCNLKELAVLDIKCTSKIYKSHFYQVCGYDLADGMADNKSNAIVLRLTPDKFELREACPNDYEIFKAAALLSKVRRDNE